MIGAIRPPIDQTVTVFGGSGFLGTYVVGALAQRGYRVLVPTRQPNLTAFFPLGRVGQIYPLHVNLRNRDSVVHAVAKADHVINLVGILQESGRQSFEALQAEGPRIIAEATPRTASLTHVSAIGADANSESAYARSKAAGEEGLLSVRPDAVVMRPSLLFGPGDSFFTRFATLTRLLPVLPLAGAGTRFQPVYAGDVAAAILGAVEGTVPRGQIYEFGGPQVATLRELVEYVLRVTQRRRFLVPVSAAAGRMQGSVLGTLDRITLGLLADELVMTRDQAILLESDNVVSPEAVREGRTLEGLGITPTAYEGLVDSYLIRFRKTGQFDFKRNAPTIPDIEAPPSVGPLAEGGPGHPTTTTAPTTGH